MSVPRPGALGFPTSGPVLPSRDGLRLILAGTAYLLAISLLQLTVTVTAMARGTAGLPGHLMDVRDVVALYGWVGLMISGVSVIIVPNHLRVRLRPSWLPRLHLVLANAGLGAFFALAVVEPQTVAQDAALAVVSASYVLFAFGLVTTVAPFLRRVLGGTNDPTPTAAPMPVRAGAANGSPGER